MNINSVLEMLNKEYGVEIDGAYYEYVKEWLDWWEGKFAPFHVYKEKGDGGKIIARELYTMKMAKKVSEDWASILLNEKTEIVFEDKDKASSEFLQGKDGEGGVFGASDFWVCGNELIEKAFSSGTGAAVVRFLGMMANAEGEVISDEGAQVAIDYIDALNIIPLTVRRRQIIDVAFASEVYERGEKFVYVETHILENGKYHIKNRYFKEEEGHLLPHELPEGMAEELTIPTSTPMFSIVSPNIVNNVSGNRGLGLSVYANAIDQLKGVDLAFNNSCRDFKLGGKKVFLDRSLVRQDEHGNVLTPDDVAQQLFMPMGDGDIDAEKKLIQEFNPSLRVAENKDGVQAHLDYLSFKVGLGTKHYQFNGDKIVTATQYSGDKQELVQNAAKHYIVVQRWLRSLVKAILWAGREVCGADANPDAVITINFEDGYIIDKESERLRDLQEVREGLMLPWEYRMKWRGESEEEAKAALADARTDDEYMGFGGKTA